MIKIPYLNDVGDEKARENFKYIQRRLLSESLLKGNFVFFEKTLSSTGYPATILIKHNLSFTPEDIIQTRLTGGTLTWNYSSFDGTNLSATISASVVVRFFAGKYEENR